MRVASVALWALQVSALAGLVTLTVPEGASALEPKLFEIKPSKPIAHAHGKAHPATNAQPFKLPELSAFAWPRDEKLKALFKPHMAGGEPHPAQGLGLFAITRGRSADLTEPDRWAEDSEVGSSETKVGFGWRKRNVSAMFGYRRPDFSRDPYAPEVADHAEYLKPRSSVGLSLAFRYH